MARSFDIDTVEQNNEIPEEIVKAGMTNIEYMRVVRRHYQSISEYKLAVEGEKYVEACELWFDIDVGDANILQSLAPSKGGVLTTRERDIMKTNEWSDARKELFNTP